ncbi:MAG: macrolide ABC transporter permease/ATP-binding protein MacB, partial [Acidobacteriota bacterium]|nr:macrolide ABC transporter permease/ATP-binding protein MacB [Acidobacteriota bacterium]
YEPTSALDTKTGAEIMALFDRLHEQGNAIIVVTYEPSVAEHAHRIIHLRDGQIEKEQRHPLRGKSASPNIEIPNVSN